MKNLLLVGLTGLFLSTSVLLAQPRLTIQQSDPTTKTPPYIWWISPTNLYGQATWMVQGGQTRDLCKDVTITWTTEPNKVYSLETLWPDGPTITLMPPTHSGTNRTMSFDTGTKFSSHFFRVRVW